MNPSALRLTVYDTSAARSAEFRGDNATYFVYAPDGLVAIRDADGDSAIAPDEGRFVSGQFAVTRSKAWVFELAPVNQAPSLADGTDIVLSHPLDPAFEGPAILRADRVASDPGSRTPRHGHRGAGIRRLLRGAIRAAIGERVERFDAGRAWFESGSEWVIGENISGGENVFVRVMLLPADLAGGLSSFVPAAPEEAKAPRAINYRLFGEITLDR
ncbi:hypothetical protein [Mangrovicella endophytica]|uniref:hypothetical protein n=1 Tax=Mangrovicella endophytica TaxID=2066697 RepID=UPI000C9E3899|nr:hypothetical protein [Mangrovicella endophytica]